MKLIVQYLEINYEIEADEEICNKILTDPVYAAAFMEQNLSAQNAEHTEEDSVSTPTNLDYAQENTGNIEKESSWEHRTVLLFLEECSRHKHELRNPKIRRRTVFLKIKEAMEGKGYNFKESSLEKKLGNLKIRYNRILDNNKKTSTGRGRMSWPYFEQMCLIYEDEVNVRDAPTVSSLNPSSLCAPSDCTPSDCTPSTSKQATLRSKLVALEEEKVEIARGVLNELKEMRVLKQKRLEFEMLKYKEEKENRTNN
ncbi:uncharacterized protein LOC129952514 isoform X2 [Eupeodes corollae]|uniref:uncharacterized protein LOC129952514 isoform X2 n=2 Tax=Eupeodes corollae TaxID=290404 RepID=UPI00248F48FF|nr:uncharacterized protein LOC129952514 isoform X2 [Eupeodes corollae]